MIHGLRGRLHPVRLALWVAAVGLSAGVVIPGFPVELVGIGEIHAAFLDESRTRGLVQRNVQEIRVAQRADTPDTVKNPFAGDPAAVAAGRDMYAQTCQSCHGGEARGDRGPALATGNFRHGGEDSDLFQTIRMGVPGTQMPAFPALPTDTIWRIIAYLRSLNANSATANEVVAGDAVAGEQTFWGKGGCASCHEVNGRGADVGPDLSAAGTNSASYLRSVILNPNNPQLRRRRFFGPSVVRVKTKSGQQIRGITRAEDSYNLILTDTNGTLLSD